MDLFLAHCLFLTWASIGAARRLAAPIADQILIAALLAWGNVVATSLLLASSHRLGAAPWFFSTSLFLAGLTSLLLLRVPPEPPTEPAGAGPNPWLRGAFILTLIPLGLAGASIAWTYQPNNPDSLVWQLPRAMYYLGQNSLAHFDAADLRQTHLPFDYNLLQVFGLVYGPSLQCLNLFNLVAWVVGGVAVYRLCRVGSIGANAALIACWLVLTATPVLAQANSTTLELPAGVALLCALGFAQQWRQTRLRRHALLAGLAAGLAAGSDLRVALLCATCGGLGLAWSYRHRRPAGLADDLRAWVVPALVACALGAPFALINFAAAGNWISLFLGFTLPQQPVDAVPDVWTWFLPLWRNPSPLLSLNEDTVSFGFTGALFLLGAAYNLARPRQIPGPAGWGAWLGLGWILLNFCPPWGQNSGPRDFVPALLLLGPGMAKLIESGRTGPRSARTLILLGAALVSGWSAGLYLLKNTSRPLIPLLNASFTPPALPTLPLLMEHHLTNQPRINVDTDGINERVFPFLAQRPGQRATSRHQPDPAAYNLISRSTASRTSAFVDLARRPAYTFIPIPSKRTAGVEFLATLGTGSDARDYFGLEPQADRTPPIISNRCLLVTLYPAPAGTTHTRIRVAGLNPADRARLAINLEYADGRVAPLTVFEGDGEATLSILPPFRQLAFRVLDTESGGEIGATAIACLSKTNEPAKPIDPRLPTSSRTIFVTDVVLAKGAQAISAEGLLPVEGPFPQWDLPYLRWQREPSSRITIPAMDQLARLQLSFSVRLHVRKKAALDVLFNGQPVRRYRIDDPTVWLDQILELSPVQGPNVLEFRDAPLNDEPDWMGYLERYPDVKKYLVGAGLPLEQGAREHYETHGRAEGRILQIIAKPEPAPDGYFFMYRNIRLEGFKSP